MQRANCMVRLNGDLNNVVPKSGVTPAEILILRHIHGQESVVDIRPTEFDERVRNERELERLARAYDQGSSFVAKPGDQHKSVIETLFPGAMKKLPLTLEEIGIDSGAAAAAPEPTIVPDLPPVGEDAETENETTDAIAEGDAGAGAGEAGDQGSATAE
jgi:hypothetical protein